MITITIHNDKTGNETVANYDYEVFVNKEKIAKGRVENHLRQTGWQGLMKRLGEVSGQATDVKKEVMYKALVDFLTSDEGSGYFEGD